MKSLDEFLDKDFNKDYNCSNFVVEVWKFLTGESLKHLQDSFRLSTTRKVLLEKRKKLDSPISPCLVLIRKENEIPHVGIYYDSKLIHLNALIGVQRIELESLMPEYKLDYYA